MWSSTFFIPLTPTLLTINVVLVTATSSIISDSIAFNELFDNYYARLCWFVEGQLCNTSAAEDIVQECFAKLWMRRNTISLETLSPAYLYTAVRHAALNHKRDKRQEFELDRTILPFSFADPFSHVVATETLYAVHEALQSLPNKCQQICHQVFIEGQDTATVARNLHCTEGTVRSHKAKGIAILRARLQHLLTFLLLF